MTGRGINAVTEHFFPIISARRGPGGRASPGPLCPKYPMQSTCMGVWRRWPLIFCCTQFIKSTHKYGKYLQDVYDNTALSMIQVKGRAFHQPRERSSYNLLVERVTSPNWASGSRNGAPPNSSLSKWRLAPVLGNRSGKSIHVGNSRAIRQA